MRTELAALGIRSEIAERCLNHAIKGVEGTYNRQDYFNERKDALALWTNLLQAIERGEKSNVVPLRATAAAIAALRYSTSWCWPTLGATASFPLRLPRPITLPAPRYQRLL